MIEKKLSMTFSLLTRYEYIENVSIKGLLEYEISQATLQYRDGKFTLGFKERYNKEIERALLFERRPFTIETSLGTFEIGSNQSSVSCSANLEDLANTVYEMEVYSFSSVAIAGIEHFFRFIIPIERAEWIHQIATYAYKCEDKLVKGLIDFSYNDEHFHYFPVRVKDKEYLLIDSLQKCSLSHMQDRIFAAILSVGFFTGVLHMGEVFVMASDSGNFNDGLHFMYQSLRPSVKSICPIFQPFARNIRIFFRQLPQMTAIFSACPRLFLMLR